VLQWAKANGCPHGRRISMKQNAMIRV
jgi:hypothetical protein